MCFLGSGFQARLQGHDGGLASLGLLQDLEKFPPVFVDVHECSCHVRSSLNTLYEACPEAASAIRLPLRLGKPFLVCYIESALRGRGMPTREELEDEDRRVRQLRIAVSLALSVIGQSDMTLAQAKEMVAATRGMALRLFPGKELAFDLIYLPRFRRLLAERFGEFRPV